MAHPSKNKKLEKLLEEALPEYVGGSINEDLLVKVIEALKEYDPSGRHENYHPVVHIAKIGVSAVSDAIRLRANEIVATYLYPKVKALEISKKEDREVKVTIKIAGYAQAAHTTIIDVEDIELEDGEEEGEHKEIDYNDLVLGKTDTTKLDS